MPTVAMRPVRDMHHAHVCSDGLKACGRQHVRRGGRLGCSRSTYSGWALPAQRRICQDASGMKHVAESSRTCQALHDGRDRSTHAVVMPGSCL